MAYSYRYPRPAVTADCVVFGLDGAELRRVADEALRAHAASELPRHWGDGILMLGLLEAADALAEEGRQARGENLPCSDCRGLPRLRPEERGRARE